MDTSRTLFFSLVISGILAACAPEAAEENTISLGATEGDDSGRRTICFRFNEVASFSPSTDEYRKNTGLASKQVNISFPISRKADADKIEITEQSQYQAWTGGWGRNGAAPCDVGKAPYCAVNVVENRYYKVCTIKTYCHYKFISQRVPFDPLYEAAHVLNPYLDNPAGYCQGDLNEYYQQ